MATGRIGTTPVLTTRWSKAPAGGTTSLSGLDDNSVSLVYSVGYEQVYRNGVLLSRGNDYTATNGTSITLIDATITGDIIEVFANATVALTDTYTQAQANGKFINNTLTTTTGDIIYASAANTPARLGIGSTDQVLKVSGGIPAWGAGSGMTLLSTTTLSGTSTTISDISGSYTNLMVFIYGAVTGSTDTLTLAGNGTTSVATTSVDGGTAYSYGTRNVMGTAGPTLANANNSFMYEIFDYADTTHYKNVRWVGIYAGGNYGSIGGGGYYSTSAITSFRIGTSAGTNSFTGGTVKIYGVK